MTRSKGKSAVEKMIVDELTPPELVRELDRYIVGQNAAKKTVAIALRNRYRRSLLDKELQREITPKNIIMIGSTGVGKTEIARRLSQLSGAPFLKVEATKFTEIGYVGRDVESMIRDLMSTAVIAVNKELQDEVEEEANKLAEERIIELILSENAKVKAETSLEISQLEEQSKEEEIDLFSNNIDSPQDGDNAILPSVASSLEEATELLTDDFETLQKMFRLGELDDYLIELPAEGGNNAFSAMGNNPGGGANVEIFTNVPEGLGSLGENLQDALSGILSGGKRSKNRRLKAKKAFEILLQEQREKLVDEETTLEIARERVENQGIIFIDEIDKIAVREGYSRGGGGEVSREGVQRDILPIVEGSQVRTRYGMIDTTHILFIAAGAFNLSKPSDLIPELQGRFPLRVELESLTADSLQAILSTPKNSLIFQYIKLLETEGIQVEFLPEALQKIASLAVEVNASTEDIGARRLHTILETLLEDLSFASADYAGKKVTIDEAFVVDKLQDIVVDQDLSRYIL